MQTFVHVRSLELLSKLALDDTVQDGNPAKQAVRSLTMAVGRGECFGLLGPNGAGKVCNNCHIAHVAPSTMQESIQGKFAFGLLTC